jgi:hypothetical protein
MKKAIVKTMKLFGKKYVPLRMCWIAADMIPQNLWKISK